MNISLEEIIIYNQKWEDRTVSLKDWLNIITWYSKTWKSALIEIINYCFFSRFSNIPIWVIKNFAHIYVIVLKIDDNILVIWREEKKQNNCYIFNIDNISDLKFDLFNPKNWINVDNARNLILKKFWVNVEEKYWTLNDWAVSIRNILPLILQPQHLIANKYALFISFDDYIRKIAVIDEFPYFLRIINNDYLRTKRRLDDLNKNIKKEDNETIAKENQYSTIREKLKNEITDFLINLWIDKKNISTDINELLKINLDNYFNEKFNSNKYNYSLDKENIISTRKERDDLNRKLQEINSKLNFIDTTENEINKYYNNISVLKWLTYEQKWIIPKECICPICSNTVDVLNTSFDFIDENITFLSKEVSNLEYYDENIENKRSELLKQKLEKKEQIKAINEYMSTLEKVDLNNDYTIYEKLIVLKTRINTEKDYLKELMALNKTSTKNKDLEEIAQLKIKLKWFNIENKLQELNKYLNLKINSICSRLDVEEQFIPSKLEFDFSNFSLFYNDNWEKTYLSEIWSWANILAWHISLFLWLLWLSLKTESFLPKFLLIDQPTQVYFPEKNTYIDENNDIFSSKTVDNDFQNVEKLYTVILEELDKMEEEFWYKPQVIIMDHANNLELWDKYNFSYYVRKNWRNWKKLI